MINPPLDVSLSYFLDLAESRARLTPRRVAVVDYSWGSREEYTYHDMERAASATAAILSGMGVGKGDVVSVLSYNNVEYVYLFLATAKVGYILAPLNWRLSPPELAFMIDDLKPKVIFYHPELQGTLEKALREASHRPGRLVSIEALRGVGSKAPSSLRKARVDLEDIQMLLYTGGTTGKPKAAMIPYRQTLFNALNTVLSWGLTPEDSSPLLFPMFHTGGWHVITVPLYLVGGRVVLTKRFDPDEAVEIIERERCTVVIGVPTMFFLMAKSPRFREARFESVRFFKSGGGMSPLGLMREYWSKGKMYFQGYGLTEAGPNLFYTPPEDMERKPMSVGKPGLFVEVRIVKEDGSEAAPGEVGELWVRGPIVFAGYWNRPEETREAIVDGWVRTGDLFTRDEDGHYYFVERKKFMIKTGGENVYPSEVEDAIRQHPAVEEVAVFGVPDPKWGEAVAAVVKLREGARLTLEELKEFLKPRLAGYKIPKYLWVVDEVPKTPVGKVDYVRLRRQYSRRVGADGR